MQLASPDAKSELRRLQFDAVAAFVEAQRKVVALHNELIAMLRADRALYQQQRVESLELSLACDALHELVRDIERVMNATAN